MADCPTLPNEQIQCPYVEAHFIEQSRMQFHLSRCRRSWSGSNPPTACPFDTSHMVPQLELNFHVTICPNRYLFDELKYKSKDVVVPVEPAPLANVPVQEESWDNMEATTYDPTLKATEENILTVKRGAIPSERRNYRMDQRRRFEGNPSN